MTQLTLTLRDDLVQQAEAYARETGRSLESLLESYLENVVKAQTQQPPLSPQVQALYGSLKLPDDFDYKESLMQALRERYDI